MTEKAKSDDPLKVKWAEEDTLKSVSKLSDALFGEVLLMKNPSTGTSILVKERTANSKTAATKNVVEMQARMEANHPGLLRLLGFSTSSSKSLCATAYTLRAFYDHWESTLQAEIEDRVKKGANFTGAEMNALCYEILEGLRSLHARKVAHGDVRPQTIGCRVAKTEFALLDRLGDNSPFDKMQGKNIARRKAVYMSPELWAQLHAKDAKVTASAERNDLFSLGMTLLAAGNRIPVGEAYGPNGTMNWDKLAAHVAMFASRYPSQSNLVRLVTALVAQEESLRPDPANPFNGFTPYEQYSTLPQPSTATTARFASQEPPATNTEGYFSTVHAPMETDRHGGYYVQTVDANFNATPVHYTDATPIYQYAQPQYQAVYTAMAPTSYTVGTEPTYRAPHLYTQPSQSIAYTPLYHQQPQQVYYVQSSSYTPGEVYAQPAFESMSSKDIYVSGMPPYSLGGAVGASRAEQPTYTRQYYTYGDQRTAPVEDNRFKAGGLLSPEKHWPQAEATPPGYKEERHNSIRFLNAATFANSVINQEPNRNA